MTDSDKEWLLGVLTEVVGASEKRLNARLSSIEVRLSSMETRLDSMETRLDSLEARLEALETRVARLEEELPAALERMETKLLTAFHSWASPMEMRVRSHTAVLNALDLEI